MPFPTAPKGPRPIKGTVKIQIRQPVTTEVRAAPETEVPVGKDYSGDFSVSAPPGFSVDGNLYDFYLKQEGRALRRLRDIKSRGCGTCRNKASAALLAEAQQYVEHVCQTLRDSGKDYITVVVGQQRDGAITVDLTGREKRLSAVVYQGFINLLSELEGGLRRETETHLYSAAIDHELRWLMGD